MASSPRSSAYEGFGFREESLFNYMSHRMLNRRMAGLSIESPKLGGISFKAYPRINTIICNVDGLDGDEDGQAMVGRNVQRAAPPRETLTPLAFRI